MKFLTYGALLAAALLLPGVASATSSETDTAEALLSAGKPLAALRQLKARHDPATATGQEYFLLGLAAKQGGKLSEAERWLSRAVAAAPAAGRIRLELAEVLFARGNYDRSGAELSYVHAMDLPPQVRSNVASFMARVSEVKADPTKAPPVAKDWSAQISTGLGYDSNANAGPSSDTIFLYGMPFTLSPNAKATSDVAWFLNAGVSYRTRITDTLAWSSHANLAFHDYFDADAFDTLTLGLSSGPDFRINERIAVSVPLGVSSQHYTDMGGWYSRSVSLGFRLRYLARENLQFYLDTSIARRNFQGNAARNLWSWSVSPSLNFQPYQAGNIAVGLQLGRENAGDSVHSNQVRGAFIGYQHMLIAQHLRLSATASYTATDFSGIQVAHGVARSDRSQQLALGLSWTPPKLGGFGMDLNVNLRRNNSNIDLNRYSRSQISWSLTRSF